MTDKLNPAEPGLTSWLTVIALLALATAAGLLLDHHVSLASQSMLYVLAVVVAAYRLSTLPSVICALGAVTAFNFFFVPPRWTFEVASQEHLIAMLAMLVVALVISHLTATLRRQTRRAHLLAQRAGQLRELATELAATASDIEVLTLGQQALEASFAGPCTLALLRDDETLLSAESALGEVEDGLRSSMREAATLGPGTGRWPGLNAWYLPVGTREHMHGAVCIQNVVAADEAGREHAQALCALLAQTLWRVKASAQAQRSQAEAQRQQVQSTFLAAISHDLRTPLATVVGAASALQTQGDKLGAAEQARLLASIVSEASHLSNITENTLQLVQLTNSPQALRLDWESMEEIIGSVLARVRQRDPARRIQSQVPEQLPLIRADAVLLAQLLGNLLDNALKYSPQAIDLEVMLHAQTMQVAVKDRGEAIAQDKAQEIFEPYARDDRSGQRGAGLGLALCLAIARAHGGSLVLRRRQGGGNSFVLSLPLPDAPPLEMAP